MKNKALVSQVVLLVIDGLSWAAWQQRKAEWERMRAFFQPEEEQQPVRMGVKTSLFSPHTVMQDYCSVAVKRDKPTDRNSSEVAHKRQRTAEESKTEEHKQQQQQQRQPAVNPLEYCLTETEMRDNKYPIVGEEAGFLHSCDHHQLQGDERRQKVEEARQAGMHCIHTQPIEGEDGGSSSSLTPALETEVLAEKMDEEGEREDGEIRESEEVKSEKKEDNEMEDDFVLHTSSHSKSTVTTAASNPPLASHLPSPSASFPALFAIDCEMCYTSVGLELTRLTLIDLAVSYAARYAGSAVLILSPTTTLSTAVSQPLCSPAAPQHYSKRATASSPYYQLQPSSLATVQRTTCVPVRFIISTLWTLRCCFRIHVVRLTRAVCATSCSVG